MDKEHEIEQKINAVLFALHDSSVKDILYILSIVCMEISKDLFDTAQLKIDLEKEGCPPEIERLFCGRAFMDKCMGIMDTMLLECSDGDTLKNIAKGLKDANETNKNLS